LRSTKLAQVFRWFTLSADARDLKDGMALMQALLWHRFEADDE